MPRPHGLEARLFGWLLALALVPTLSVLVLAIAVGAGGLRWVGTLGPWERVAESGRVLTDAAAGAAATDTVLAEAVRAHREELSGSLVQARRWAVVGQRIGALLPAFVLSIGVLLAALAYWLSRRLARDLARPIRDLVGWSQRMAAGSPLPGPAPAEAREVAEVRVLRDAMRAAAHDIAEGRRRALETERVQAWGEMARRVAHEMKNPLTPLRLAAFRLRRTADGTADAEALRVIEEEIGRLEELARRFATLGRPPEGPLSEVDLEELLRGLLASDVPPGIEAGLVVEPGTRTIRGHYDPLLRAFRNLLRNAVEAVQTRPGAGRIGLRLGPDANGGVTVHVEDDGTGFPDGLAVRIFEPDFTLKAGGTGLGLAVVQQAVAAHGGTIEARNGPEGGAHFIVRLPATPTTRTGEGT
jgi:two-component system nitrogen regulation sensor histidine kinase NtrY